MYLALLQTVEDDDGFNVNEGTVVWVLLVVLLIVVIVYFANRIR
jgi:hypothetical protein